LVGKESGISGGSNRGSGLVSWILWEDTLDFFTSVLEDAALLRQAEEN
jgi:hypothetical protein